MEESFECDVSIGEEGCQDDEFVESCGEEGEEVEERPRKRNRKRKVANEDIKGEVSDNDEDEDDSNIPPGRKFNRHLKFRTQVTVQI